MYLNNTFKCKEIITLHSSYIVYKNIYNSFLYFKLRYFNNMQNNI